MEFLDKKGIRSVKEYTHDKFGHTWMNAKYFLDKSLRLLFRPEAAEEAMKNGQPALAATGNEPQFTAGVMARLFPRPILSPEYRADGIVFRFKAPDAKDVSLVSELSANPISMQRDSDGVWEVEIKEHIYDTFTYYYLVDGTPVADPQNMYLAPSKGFKPSICQHPASPYHFAAMGKDIPHGTVRYDLNTNTGYYFPPTAEPIAPVLIRLILGPNDTKESWFKVGGADAIADKLFAEGKTKPCNMITDAFADADFSNAKMKVYTLKASDYKTWEERRRALETLLLKTK
jgi:hypothetical protein